MFAAFSGYQIFFPKSDQKIKTFPDFSTVF